MKNAKGMTLVELIVVIAISSIIGFSIVAVMFPQFQLFLSIPGTIRMEKTAQELLDVFFEGDTHVRGLRYATSIETSTETTLSYDYLDENGVSHRVVYTYNVNGSALRRAVDGASAQSIPYYAASGSDLRIQPVGGQTIFRYIDHLGRVFSTLNPGQVVRIELAARILTADDSTPAVSGIAIRAI